MTYKTNKTLKECIAFGCVGVSGLLIGLLIINASMALTHHFVFSNIVAFLIVATWNFFLNKKYTFKDANNRVTYINWLLFIGSSLLGLILNWTTSFSLYYSIDFFRLHYNAAVLVGVFIGYCVNFVCSKKVVFKGSQVR
jgi:putative flippase GtrA